MPAKVHDTFGAGCLLAGLKVFVLRLSTIWAEQAYQGQEMYNWCKAMGHWELEVVKRTPGVHGWSKRQVRWIVARTLAWLRANRRLVIYYERNVQTGETVTLGRDDLSAAGSRGTVGPPTCQTPSRSLLLTKISAMTGHSPSPRFVILIESIDDRGE